MRCWPPPCRVDAGRWKQRPGLHGGKEHDGAFHLRSSHAGGGLTSKEDRTEIVDLVGTPHGRFHFTRFTYTGGIAYKHDQAIKIRGSGEQTGPILGGGKIGLDHNRAVLPERRPLATA